MLDKSVIDNVIVNMGFLNVKEQIERRFGMKDLPFLAASRYDMLNTAIENLLDINRESTDTKCINFHQLFLDIRKYQEK